MRNKKVISAIAIIIAVLMLVMLVVSVIPATAFAEVTQADIDAVQQRKDELLAQREASQAKIDGLKEQQASVIEQKAALDERNELALEQLALIREQVELYSQMIQEKAKEVEQARAVEQEQLARYRTRVRAMEENGGFDVLSLLVRTTSVGQLLSIVDDVGEIMARDRQLEDEYIAAREAFEKVKAEYEATKAELDAKQAELEEEQAELERMIREAAALIEELDADIEQATKEYEEAERARQAAAAEVARLIAELNRQNAAIAAAKAAAAAAAQQAESGGESQSGDEPAQETPAQETAAPEETGGESTIEVEEPPPADEPGQAETPSEPETPAETEAPQESGSSIPSAGEAGVVGDGSLLWPVPSGHVVTSPYGNRVHPITGEERFHSGMDIDGYGHDGEAVVACDAGVVATATYSSSYGNYIIIDHGNGMQTLYAHMSGLAVGVGDTVTKGQTIGYLGATGWATGTHCHLEVFVNGSRTDPAGYFSGFTYYNG